MREIQFLKLSHLQKKSSSPEEYFFTPLQCHLLIYDHFKNVSNIPRLLAVDNILNDDVIVQKLWVGYEEYNSKT